MATRHEHLSGGLHPVDVLLDCHGLEDDVAADRSCEVPGVDEHVGTEEAMRDPLDGTAARLPMRFEPEAVVGVVAGVLLVGTGAGALTGAATVVPVVPVAPVPSGAVAAAGAAGAAWVGSAGARPALSSAA